MSVITYNFPLDASYTSYGNGLRESVVYVGRQFPQANFSIKQVRLYCDTVSYNWCRAYVQIHHKNSPWFWHEGGFPYRGTGSDTGYTTFKQAGLTGAGTQYGGLFFVNGDPVRVPRVVNQAYDAAYNFASGSLWGHVGFQADNSTGALSNVVGATYDGYATYRHSYGGSWLLEADPGNTLVFTCHNRGIWTANSSLALPSSSYAGAPGSHAYRDYGTHNDDTFSTGRDTLGALPPDAWALRPTLYHDADGATEDAIAQYGYLEAGMLITDYTWLAEVGYRDKDWMCCGTANEIIVVALEVANLANGPVTTIGNGYIEVDVDVAVTGRIITSPLNDSTFRPQYLGHKTIVEVTADPPPTSEDAATWTTLESGYCTRATLQDALTWEIGVGDTDRIEREAELFAGPDLVVGQPSVMLGGPVLGNFGDLVYGSKPLFEVESRQVGKFITLKYVSGRLGFEDDARADSDYAERNYLNNVIAAPLAVPSQAYAAYGRHYVFPQIVVKLYDPDTNLQMEDSYGSVRAVWGEFTPLSLTETPRARGFRPGMAHVNDWVIGDDFRITIDWGEAGVFAGGQPVAGIQFRLAAFVTQAGTLTPFHFDGHPVDIATQVYTALGIPWDVTSRDDTKAALGPDMRVLLRPVGTMKALAFLEQYLYGPFGFAYRIVDGARVFYPTRYRDTAVTPSTTVTLADLRGEGSPYEVSDSHMVGRVVWEEEAYFYWDQTSLSSSERPLDNLLPRKNVTTFLTDDPNAPPFLGAHTYKYPGLVVEPLGAEGAGSWKGQVAEELFYRWGRGLVEIELPLLPSFTNLIGDFIVNEVEYSPIPEAGEVPVTVRPKDYPLRSPRQILQVVKRSESPVGPLVRFQVVGPVAADVPGDPLTTPTLSLAAGALYPANSADITVTNWATIAAESSTNRVDLQYGVGATEPTEWSSAGFLSASLSTGISTTPLVAAGAHVWVRARTWNTDGRVGSWSSTADIDLNGLTAPSNLAGVVVADTRTVDFTWTNGETDVGLRLRWTTGVLTEWYDMATLPAGTTRFTYTFPDVSTAYRVEVYHAYDDPALGESAHDETNVTTGATTPTLSAPTSPAATTGSGEAVLCVSQGDARATQTAFYAAPETASGTFDTFTLYALVAQGSGRVCGGDIFANETSLFDPTRRRWYQLRATHRAPGYTESAASDAVTVDPWDTTMPLTAYGVFNDDGVLLGTDAGNALNGAA